MDGALEEIEFLALSANRIEVLAALSDEDATRRELAAEVGASQPTLSRILSDFRERNWVRERDGVYTATATGRLVADGITDLYETMTTEQKLRDVVVWLPTEVIDFDLRRLHDASLVVPSRTRPNAPIQRATDLLESATDVRIVSHAFNEQSLTAVHDRVVAGEQTVDAVLSRTAVDALAADTTLRRRLREVVATDGATVSVVDGEIPVAVGVTDDVVHLLLRDDDGVLQGVLVSEDETVLSWAETVHERYRADATRLGPADLG